MRTFVRAGALVCLLAVVAPASATCPGSAGDRAAIAAAQSRVAEACDCTGIASHSEFVRCATGVVRFLVRSGALRGSCRSPVTRCARVSPCGVAGAVTCCRTRNGRTRCRLEQDAARCRLRGGTPCTGPFGTCCPDCVATGCPPPTSIPSTSSTSTTTSSTTSTTLGVPCSSAVAPACGGDCPAGGVCQAGATIQGATTTRFCQCVASTAACGPFTSDCDFGVCAPGSSCTADFDLFLCGCR